MHPFDLRLWLGILLLGLVGCRSMTYGDQGTLLGGVGGAGVGALVGEATGGNAGPGAIIGAGLGALGGGLVGNGLDEIEARNRAEIAAQLGRQIPPGGVSVPDVMTMVAAGVDEELVVNHIRANGVVAPLSAQDVIALQQQGVSKGIIAALQTSPPPRAVAPQGVPYPVPGPYPPPVIVQEHHYGPPPPWFCPPHFFYHHHGHRRPRTSVGFSISN